MVNLQMEKSNCLLTGGGNGIGRQIALDLLKNTDYNVTCIYRSNVIDMSDFDQYKNRILFIKSDVTDCCYENIFKQSYSVFGNYPNRYVINAGMRHRNNLELTSDEELSYLWKTNYFAFRDLVVNIINHKVIDNISLVYISSIVGQFGFLDLDDYGSTKAASDSLIRSLSVRFTKSRFNSVSPGFTKSSYADSFKERLPELHEWTLNRTPLNRWAECSEISSVVKFLLSEDSRYITGQNINVDGGWSCNA